MVLLKNDDDLLPLASETRVAVVGDFAATPRYQGAGSSLINPTRVTSALEALEGRLQIAGVAQGFRRNAPHDPELVDEAVRVARDADVVLLHIGLDELSESEGRDREHLRLPESQLLLIEALALVGTPVVAVLSAGAPIQMPWLEDASAVVHGYLGGQAGAEGMADILLGAANPSGRLAETYLKRLSDSPTAGAVPSHERDAVYHEGVFVGYRYTTTAGVPVLFPFGFGLSYTSFTYSDLMIDADGVTFTLTNTGDREGAEVAQLYVAPPVGASGRPTRELKGFQKVELAPGESRTVTIPFDEYTFRTFDMTADAWAVPEGDYGIAVAASVEDLRLTGALRVGSTGERQSLTDEASAVVVGAMLEAEPRSLEFESLPAAAEPRRRVALSENDPLLAMEGARSPLARFAEKRLAGMLRKADAKGTPDLNLLFLTGMPFRAMGKMTGGAMSEEMVDSLVATVNGRHLAGLGGLVRGFFANRSREKTLNRLYEQQSSAGVKE
ncbi:MAG TPA: hypothetical protein GX743_07395 [Actinomycetales bacterium]|nr:hypothetical protein [Actinomycetales bacterium]